MNKIIQFGLVTLILLAGSVAVSARDKILIVGSSTVFPYTQSVAEQFVNLYGVELLLLNPLAVEVE